MSEKLKITQFGPSVQEKIFDGANFLANTVKRTLGPYGRNAIIGVAGGTPHITNDGVTIAREIQRTDIFEDLGVRALREACLETVKEVGDGTTTAATLAQAIFTKARAFLPDGETFKGKLPPAKLIAQIRKEEAFVVEALEKMSVKVETREQLIEIARVSVEDEELAALIGGSQWDVGPNGTLIVEDSTELRDSVEMITGVRIDNGYGTSYMLNNNEKGTLELDKVAVIFTNHIVKDLQSFGPIFEQLVKNGVSDVALVARAFTTDAIRLCMANHQKGFRIYAINAPFTDQNEIMEDMAAVLGGSYINAEKRKLNSIMLSDIGAASRIVASRWYAVFTGNDSDMVKARITERTAVLEEKLKAATSPFEKRHIETRISQLRNGFGIVKVGQVTTAEHKRRKDKVEDAVNAVKAALQDGVVPGAGQALKEIDATLPEDFILKGTLSAPFEQIMANAGEPFTIEDWVRDPAKVVRVAFQKAVSAATVLATADIGITYEREKPRYMQEGPAASSEEDVDLSQA